MKTTSLIFITILLLLFPVRGRAVNEPGWNCDIHAFQYDMSIYLQVRQNDNPLAGDYMVAAFSNGECRGIAEVQSVDNTSYFYLRVRSNQETGDSIYFKVYDREAGKELVTSGSFVFENLKQVGYPSHPWTLMLPVVIGPGEEGGLGQVTETTEILQLTGQWTSDDIKKLSAIIHKEENGEQINDRLSTVDMSGATIQEDVSLNGVFTGCSFLTSVTLPDLSTLKDLSSGVFEKTNPNCIVFLPNKTNIPEQWNEDVNIVVDGMAEQLILEENKPFHTSRAFKAKQAVYRRTIGKGSSLKSMRMSTPSAGWETICLPFNVDVVMSGTDKELTPVSRVGTVYSGDFYIATLTERGFEWITERQETAPCLEANMPYLLNMTTPENDRIEGTITFKSKGEVTIKTTASSYTLERSHADLVGVFKPQVASDRIYAMNKDGNAFINKGGDVLPFEAYLRPKATSSPTSIPVEMYVAVAGVKITPASLTIEEGKTATLTATVLPENATVQSLKWSSSNESVATVSSAGLVSSLKEGTATITVQTEEGTFTATSLVTVTKSSIPPVATVKVTGVTISPESYTLTVDKTVQLSALVRPSDASNKNVAWSSNDATVASVDATGLVSGHKTGHAIITVRTDDGDFKANSYITISQTTNMQEANANSVSVYPTLVSGSFVVSGLQEEGQIGLYSYTGQLLKTLKTKTSASSVDVSDLQSGQYIVKVTQKSKTSVFKIIRK